MNKKIVVVILVFCFLLTSCGAGEYILTLESGENKIVTCKREGVQVNHDTWMEFRCDGSSYKVLSFERK